VRRLALSFSYCYGYTILMAKKRKNPAAVALGRLGGLAAAGAGIRKRIRESTPEERSALARKAVMARWAKKRQKQ
jgi:hypothetical protein